MSLPIVVLIRIDFDKTQAHMVQCDKAISDSTYVKGDFK